MLQFSREFHAISTQTQVFKKITDINHTLENWLRQTYYEIKTLPQFQINI